MWIRCQHKLRLVMCNNVYIYNDILLNSFVVINEGRTDITLGIYSTKEKALKVLDKIVEEINYGDLQNVFQMPQDEEVDLW